MFIYLVSFILNLLNIFIIDKKIMLMGFVPATVIYFLMLIVMKNISLSSKKVKYFILFCIISTFTFIGVSITYHAVILAVLPILYAIIYSSKRVIWYAYGLTVISTIIIVIVGYYNGLCDANMVLTTTTKLGNYISPDGLFTLREVNNSPLFALTLYYIVPRCLIYIAVISICEGIIKVISEGVNKAKHAIEMEVFQEALKHKVDEQTVELREKTRKVQEAYWQTVTALSEAVDAKDRYTSGHSRRVAEYSKMIAKRMGKSASEQEMIYRAGLLHDVGKIGVPVEIINKPGKLTDGEFDLIKNHPITGYHILKEISEYGDIAVAAKYHHERYDGNGYPNGLVGENIPESARILGVADSYDAMTSNRSYRKGLPQDIVRGEIEKGKGKQFDPQIADIMLQMMNEDKEYKLRQIDRMDYKILVIGEDDENNQRIKQIMEEENIYEVIFAKELEDVIEKLEQNTIDLIILDIQMNQNTGWKILQRIKEIYRIPTVLMSDDNDLRNTKEFKEFGCDDYITKAFGALMIKEIVYNMTKKCK
jgi:putative nucleotidyltransferase with HDIG domain